MNHFETKVVAKRMAEFARLNAKLLPVGDWRGDFKRTLDRAVLAAEQNGLSDSATRLKEIIKESGHGRLNEHSVAAYANSAESVIRNELAKRKFLVVSPELSNYLDKDRLFGDKVWHGFPSARADIREAGNCLATGCNTAAVFHLMRAVEWGLRALATDLGVRRLRGVRRSGRATLTPVAYSQWKRY